MTVVATRLEVRCPKCNALQLVILTPGSGVIEVACRKHRCDAILIVEASGKVSLAPRTCQNKFDPLVSA